jgi:drug/metabolite transporter (DMT)-like permease
VAAPDVRPVPGRPTHDQGRPSLSSRVATVPSQPPPSPPSGASPSPPSPSRARLLTTGRGTNLEAFGAVEWSLLAAVAIIWGSSFVLMEIGLRAFEPGLVTLLRVGLGATALALIPRARRVRIPRDDLPRVLLLGVTWMGVPLLLFPLAQQWVDSSVAGMLNGAMPLTTAAWSALLLGRLPARTQAIGLVVGFLGIVAISVPELPIGGIAAAGTTQTALGTALVLVAIVLYGLSANVTVPLTQQYGSLPVLFRAQLAALVVIAPFGVAAIPGSHFAWGPALAMLPLGILGTGLAFVLMGTLVGRVGGPRGSIAIYFVPVVAIVLGVVALGEAVHPVAILGTGLVLVGAWVTSRRETDRPPVPAAPSVPPSDR